MKGYAIHKQVRRKRRTVYGEGDEELRWERDEACGIHPTKLQAIRTFIVALEPSLKDATDHFIRKHWQSFRINHSVKVIHLNTTPCQRKPHTPHSS